MADKKSSDGRYWDKICLSNGDKGYISREYLKQLNDITNKMAKFDFSQKYRSVETDDEINELGNSINLMSEKLESTIKQLRSTNIELEKDIEEKSKIDEMRKSFISDVSFHKNQIRMLSHFPDRTRTEVSTRRMNWSKASPSHAPRRPSPVGYVRR